MAAVWPDLAELKKTLDVDGDEWDTQLGKVMTAAIDKVKADRGDWDEDDDEPDERLYGAALRAAVLLQANSGNPEAVDRDEIYVAFLKGKRRRFGFS